MTFKDERLEIGAGSVDCGSKPGAAGANDDGIANRVWHMAVEI
jgi:hypothetical protein